jgi:hypothetical protein
MKTTRRGFLGLLGAAVVVGPTLATETHTIAQNPCWVEPPTGTEHTGITVDGEPVFEIHEPVEIHLGGIAGHYQPDGGSYVVGVASRYPYTSKFVLRDGAVIAIDPRVKWAG